MEGSQLLEQVQAHRMKESDLRMEHFAQYEVFSVQWWIMLAVTIGCWLLWWRLSARPKLLELLLFGAVISDIATELDGIGVDLSWWAYRIDLAPVFDRLFMVDMAVLPVAYMLTYQYFPQWGKFIVANAALAVLFAFVAEPLAYHMGIYVPLQWKHYYSVPFYIAMPLFTRSLVEFIKWIQHRSHSQ